MGLTAGKSVKGQVQRALVQIRKWARSGDPNKYTHKVVKKIPRGYRAREKGYAAEKAKAERLKKSEPMDRHKRP